MLYNNINKKRAKLLIWCLNNPSLISRIHNRRLNKCKLKRDRRNKLMKWNHNFSKILWIINNIQFKKNKVEDKLQNPNRDWILNKRNNNKKWNINLILKSLIKAIKKKHNLRIKYINKRKAMRVWTE